MDKLTTEINYAPTGYKDKEFLPGSRTRFLFYRCEYGHPITCIQLEDAWKAAEYYNMDHPNDNKHANVCWCGTRKLKPSNPSFLEELTRPSIWKLWALKVFLPWFFKKTRCAR
jgi:hypothetical protein